MNDNEFKDSLNSQEESNGSITFSTEVIADIVRISIQDVKGLVMNQNVLNSITGFLGKKNTNKGIKVELGREETAITLNIGVEFGINVPDLCQTLQQNITRSVEKMTGLRVVNIDVNVLNVFVKDELNGND